MAAYAAHTTDLNKQTKQEPHKRAYLSENGGLGKKKSGEWAKSRKGSDRIKEQEEDYSQKTKIGDIELKALRFQTGGVGVSEISCLPCICIHDPF